IGMTAAVSERDSALRQINTRRKTIEAELKTHTDYQAAETDGESARKRLGELSDDTSLTADERQKRVSALSMKIRRPTEMRKEGEANDPETQQATQRLQAAGKKITELQPRL